VEVARIAVYCRQRPFKWGAVALPTMQETATGGATASQLSEERFLAEVNRRLPAGVDWKQGAVTYLRELVADGDESTTRYHLVKPFLGGPDFYPFWSETFWFLDLVQRLDLPQSARVLDVGVGPGWTLHWLAKLGHHVIGLDISAELLEIAEQRMQADPYPPHVDKPFVYDLREHDIEDKPLHLDEPCDVAIFDACLHHFFNPVAALRNVAEDLKPDGLIGVVEGAAPPEGSEWDVENQRLIERYHTIERPYTRQQVFDMLELAGFEWCAFYQPINGLFAQYTDTNSQLVEELSFAMSTNVFIASRTREGLARVTSRPERVRQLRSNVRFIEGFYYEESGPTGTFRWARPHAVVSRAPGHGFKLRVGAHGLTGNGRQRIYAVSGGQLVAQIELTARYPDGELFVPPGDDHHVLLQSDRVFAPVWDGGSDTRLLSFRVETSDGTTTAEPSPPPAGDGG
jgi:SAM-dependent methyltransferase